MKDPQTQSRLVNTKKAAEYLSLEIGTLENWRYQHKGPRFIHVGRLVRYDLSDLDAFVEGLKEAS